MQRVLYDQSVDLQNQIEELKLDAQNSEQSLRVSSVPTYIFYLSASLLKLCLVLTRLV